MLPMAALSTWHVVTETNRARQAAYETVNLVLQKVAADLQYIIADHETHLKAITQGFMGNPPVSSQQFSSQQFVRLHSEVIAIGVSDLAGNLIITSQTNPLTGPALLATPWARMATHSRTLSVSGAYLDTESDRWVTVLTYPVHGPQGTQSGFAYLFIDLKKLNHRVLGAVPREWLVPVVDRDNRFMLRSADPQSWVGQPLSPAEAQVLQSGQNAFFSAQDIQGVNRLYAQITLPNTGWRVFAGLPESDALAAAHQKRLISTLLGLGTLVALFALAWWHAGTIAHPILALAEAARKNASGVHYRARVSGPAEVQEVARDFNQMLDHLQSEKEHREALHSHYELLVRNARDSIVLFDDQGHVIDANEAARVSYGYHADELRTLSVRDLRAVQSQENLDAYWLAGKNTKGSLFETQHRRKDGSTFAVEVSNHSVEQDGKIYWQSFIRDISAQKKANNALNRKTRALEALSQSNEALIHSKTESAMLFEVCQVIVDTAGYRMAWVAFADHDAAKHVRPVAHVGVSADYLDKLNITWSDTKQGQGPTGTAIRNRQVVIARDLQTDAHYGPWRNEAVSHGYASSIALPMMADDEVLGALNVYAIETDAFDAAEVQLLKKIASNLAFGVSSLRTRSITTQLEKDLSATNDRFRVMIEQSPTGVYVIRDGRFLYANPRMEAILGFNTGGMEGLPGDALVVPEDLPKITEAMELLHQSGRTGNFSLRVKRTNGEVIEIGVQNLLATFEGKPAIIGMAQDISERIRSQAEIQRYIALLEHTTEATLQSVSLMVEQRDPYTAGHERRVGELAAAIGEEMGLSEMTIKGLRLTGYVHDIGKIAVPAELLAKPSRLTDAEMALIKVHPQAGYDVLKNVEFPWPLAETILQHHERLDGSGYPRGLRGDAILPEARIIMVADVVESMSSHRPYRPGRGIEAALMEIEQNSGKYYDPEVVKACVRLYRDKGYALPA